MQRHRNADGQVLTVEPNIIKYMLLTYRPGPPRPHSDSAQIRSFNDHTLLNQAIRLYDRNVDLYLERLRNISNELLWSILVPVMSCYL